LPGDASTTKCNLLQQQSSILETSTQFPWIPMRLVLTKAKFSISVLSVHQGLLATLALPRPASTTPPMPRKLGQLSKKAIPTPISSNYNKREATAYWSSP